MKRRILLSALCIALLCLLPASADSWTPPAPFELWSEDGSLVFRFDPGAASWHNTTAQAAVYRKDEPEPLYTVKYLRAWAYSSRFYFSRDFRNFVFFPPAEFDIAAEFYAEGARMKTYLIRDLVKDIDQLTHSTSTVWWLAEIVHSPESDTLTVFTADGLTHLLDLTNGSLLDDSEPPAPRYLPWAAGIAILGCIVVLLLRRYHAAKRRSPPC